MKPQENVSFRLKNIMPGAKKLWEEHLFPLENLFFLRKQKFASGFFCTWHNVSSQKEHIFFFGWKDMVEVFEELVNSIIDPNWHFLRFLNIHKVKSAGNLSMSFCWYWYVKKRGTEKTWSRLARHRWKAQRGWWGFEEWTIRCRGHTCHVCRFC